MNTNLNHLNPLMASGALGGAVASRFMMKLIEDKKLTELQLEIQEYLMDKRPLDDWERGYFAALNTIIAKIKILKQEEQ